VFGIVGDKPFECRDSDRGNYHDCEEEETAKEATHHHYFFKTLLLFLFLLFLVLDTSRFGEKE
jgi:hypothetical protein